MAKVRRTIRKVERADAYFDEQMWPINVALFVLGGFLVGAAVVYQKFDDPRWYSNAWTSVIGVPLLIVAAMIALRFVSNQVVRRGMQFSLVLSLLAHLVLIVASVELNIFNRIVSEVVQTRELVERRVPDFNPFQPQEQQDHEKPIETPVPEMDSEPVEREEAEETQAAPQPTPVPEPQPNANPTVTKQRQNAPTPTPRMSDSPTQVARSQPSIAPDVARAAPQPNSAQSANRENSLQAPSTTAQRQATASQAVAQAAQLEPAQQAPSNASARRRQPENQPSQQSAPTLPRRLNTPSRLPVAQTTPSVSPSQAQQTTTDPLQAAPTSAARRQTTSPQAERTPTEPTPVQPDTVNPTPVQRQQPAPETVRVASTPQPTTSRQQRVTTRPETQTVAQQTSPQPSPNSTNAEVGQAAPTAVTRANTSVDAARSAVSPAAPNSPSQPTRANVARRQTQPAAESPSQPSPTQIARSSTSEPRVTADTPQAVAAAATANRSAQDAPLSAASTATTRNATERPQVARASGEPSNARTPQPTTNPTPVRSNRSEQASDSPTLAQKAGSLGRQQSQPNRQVQASAESLATAPASPSTSTDRGLRAAAATTSRQPTNSPGATDNNRPSRENASASATNQIAQASMDRSSPSQTPSLQPAVAASTPARSKVTGALASPKAIENPAVAKNTQSDGQQPSMQAAPTALSKAMAGVAGIGRSANLDRNEPARESPSLVASASARRRESTRADDSMSALTDSQPALVARNRAGAERPSSVLKAEAVALATAAGTSDPGELTATAGAAMTRSASDSQKAEVNASKGESEVDIGPTRLVTNSGADRAAGGGQPELNFESQNQAVARNSEGGETTMTLAVDAQAPNVTAPEADGGGEPQVQAPASTAVAQRMDAGGGDPASGGPSQAAETGPSAEPNAADKIAVLELARASSAAAETPGGAAAGAEGEEDEEDEEERARRLAAARRAAGGAPEVAIAGTEIADQAASIVPGAGQPAATAAPDAASATVARQAAAAGGMNRTTGTETTDAVAALEAQGGAEATGAVRVRRAESVDAMVGQPDPGGGAAAPKRSATGPQFVASVQADQLEMAAAEQSGGDPNSSPLAAQGVNVGRVASGRPGPAANTPLGAAAAESVSDGAGASPAMTQVQRMQVALDGGPVTGDAGELAGGPRRTLSRIGGPEVADIASPSEFVASVQPSSTGEQMAASLAAAATQIRRDSRASVDASLAADVDAVQGPSGLLGDVGSPGVSNRRARQDSIQLTTAAAKFRRQNNGGLPDFNTAAIAAATPFQKRADRGNGETGGAKGTPGPETEHAIESGLAFLTKYQLPDGSWSLKGINNEPVSYSSDAASTGLCLLAFQGAGYNHREHKYAEVVRSGLDFLIKSQDDEGSLFVPADERSNQFVKLYTHGIATIAVCEAYGMTQDPALKEPAQKALNYIIKTQDEQYGGWRYSPGRFSDTSVTGWMMMALKSGELAGLDVDKDVYTRLQLWLDRSQASSTQRHLYVYNPLAPNTPARKLGREPSKSMTAVGLLARLHLGWRRDNQNMIAGANYLAEAENLPAVGFQEELNPLKKKRDTYYWYYGTQVMFHMGGDHWKQWNNKLHPLLIDSQEKSGELAGSWDPYQPIPDRWGVAVGRLYVTTMNLLSLEVYYRHLPLYEDTAQ